MREIKRKAYREKKKKREKNRKRKENKNYHEDARNKARYSVVQQRRRAAVALVISPWGRVITF